MNDRRQGIVHVIGPEHGATVPEMTVVCGDSHASTHGALGALAHGIGTSQVEHVLATQTLLARRRKGRWRGSGPWMRSKVRTRPAASDPGASGSGSSLKRRLPSHRDWGIIAPDQSRRNP